MATVGNGIKVSGVAISASSDSVNSNLYTAPSNGYAILNYCQTESGGNSQNLKVSGNPVGAGTSGVERGTFYVGPSQIVSWSGGSGGGFIFISGVEFINS